MTRPVGWDDIPVDLLKAVVAWGEEPEVPYHYTAEGRKDLLLRVNDFPEELMFSLYVDGSLRAEFNNQPEGWTLRRSAR